MQGTPVSVVDPRVREAVNGPGIMLIISGALLDLFATLQLVMAAVQPTTSPQELERTTRAFRSLFDYDVSPELLARIQDGPGRGVGVVLWLAVMAVGVVMTLGGVKMRQLKSYPLAMAASIIALIPCLNCCCCLGIPAGVWSLVVLNKPDVRASFS